MKKRILSAFVLLCMLLTLLPVSALATEGDSTDTVTDLTEQSELSETSEQVTSEETLLTAISNAGTDDVITLGGPITLTKSLVIDSKSITLNLNGQALTASANTISVANGGALTIEDESESGNGKITAENQIDVDASSLVLNSGTIEITGTGEKSYGIYVLDGGSATVNGGEIKSNYAALAGNNTTGDMNFEVNGGTLTAAYGPAIYMPGQVTLKITAGTLNGGISLRMGQVSISGGTINATTANIDSPAEYYNYGGNAWLPDALYVFNGTYTSENATYGNSLNLSITGGTFNCANERGSAIAIYDLGKVEQDTHVSISGSATVLTSNTSGRSAYQVLSLSDIGVTEPDAGYGNTAYVGKVDTTITGGSFSSDVSNYVPNGYACTQPAQGNNWTVSQLNNGQMVVKPDTSEDGGVSATLDGVYGGGDTDITDKTGNGSGTDATSDGVVIDLTQTGTETTSATLTVTGSAANSMATDNASLTIQSSVGTLTVSNAALGRIVSNATSEGEIADVAIKVENTTPAGQQDGVTTYSLTATAGGENVFGEDGATDDALITVSIPWSGTIAPTVYYVPTSGSLVDMDAELISGFVQWTTTHFSDYMVVSNEAGATTPEASYQNSEGKTMTGSLQDAVNNAVDGSTITLLRNVELDGTNISANSGAINISNKNLTIDGTSEKFSISASSGFGMELAWGTTAAGTVHVINVESNSTVTLKNLVIDGNWDRATENYESADAVADGNAARTGINVYGGSTVTLENVEVKNCSIYALTTNNSTVTINGLTTDGSNRWGIDIDDGSTVTINDATIAEVDSIVYENDEATEGNGALTVNDGTYENLIVQVGGTSEVPNNVTGTVTLNGGTFNGTSEEGGIVYKVDGSEQEITDPDTNNPLKGKVTVNGGKYPVSARDLITSLLDEENNNMVNEDGEIVADPNQAVASIGNVGYDTLEAALVAAKDGDTIVLLQNATLTADTQIDVDITIDGQNAYKIDAKPASTHAITVLDGNSLTLKDVTLNITDDKNQTGTYGIDVRYGATLTLDNADVTLTGLSNATISASGGSSSTDPGVFNLTNGSTITATDIGGNFSNGGAWSLTGESSIVIDTCTSHGFSCDTVTVDNSSIKVSNTGLLGVTAREITLTNGASITVDDCGTNLEGNSSSWATDGESYKYPVEIKKTGTVSVDETSSIILQNNVKDGADNNVIYLVESSLDNQGTVDAEIVTKVPDGSYTVTVKDDEDVIVVAVVNDGDTYTLPTALTRDNYTFEGWSDGTTTHKAGDEVEISENTTFTAVWSYNGSSSGGSVTRYTITIEDADHGSVKSSVSRASRGSSITLTVTPDEGYELESITVTQSGGGSVSLTDKGDGKYTFTMPRANVTVEAVFAASGEQPSGGLPFTDVAADDWFYDAVAYVYENGMMEGTSATTFVPDMALSRAMVAQVLYNLEEQPEAADGAGFPDVAADAWYADAVNWAAESGVVTGYDTGAFGPEDAVTREQLAVMLYRYAQYKGYDVTASADLSAYSDAASVSAYAETAMSWAVGEELFQGVGASLLSPSTSASRAEVATILMRFTQAGE